MMNTQSEAVRRANGPKYMDHELMACGDAKAIIYHNNQENHDQWLRHRPQPRRCKTPHLRVNVKHTTVRKRSESGSSTRIHPSPSLGGKLLETLHRQGGWVCGHYGGWTQHGS